MRNRIILSLAGLCILLLAGLSLRPLLIPATAQTPTTSEVGRYSLTFGLGTEYFTDTKTGQIWVYEPIFRDTKDGPSSVVGMHWVETGSPVSKVNSAKP